MVLSQSSQFVERYESSVIANYDFLLYKTVEEKTAWLNVVNQRIADADLIVYQKITSKHGLWSTDIVLARRKPGCRLIRLPMLYNTCLFPLCKLGELTSSRTFGADVIVDCIDTKRMTLEEILQAYRNNKLDWQFPSRFQSNVQLAQQEEKETDIKCLDFFLQHYRNQQLYVDALHPSLPIGIHAANQLLDLLGVPGQRWDPILDRHRFVLPYPSPALISSAVIAHYGLTGYPAEMISDQTYVNWIAQLYQEHKSGQLRSTVESHLKTVARQCCVLVD